MAASVGAIFIWLCSNGGLGDTSSSSAEDNWFTCWFWWLTAPLDIVITSFALFCCCTCWCLEVDVLDSFWQALPSLARAGTASRRGDCGCAHKVSVSCCSCCVALSFACRFILYRWFWNQILTCVGVRWIMLARCSLSGADRYFCCLNLLSSSYTWAWEKSTRRFLLGAVCKVTMDLVASIPARVPIPVMFTPVEAPMNRETEKIKFDWKQINLLWTGSTAVRKRRRPYVTGVMCMLMLRLHFVWIAISNPLPGE